MFARPALEMTPEQLFKNQVNAALVACFKTQLSRNSDYALYRNTINAAEDLAFKLPDLPLKYLTSVEPARNHTKKFWQNIDDRNYTKKSWYHIDDLIGLWKMTVETETIRKTIKKFVWLKENLTISSSGATASALYGMKVINTINEIIQIAVMMKLTSREYISTLEKYYFENAKMTYQSSFRPSHVFSCIPAFPRTEGEPTSPCQINNATAKESLSNTLLQEHGLFKEKKSIKKIFMYKKIRELIRKV